MLCGKETGADQAILARQLAAEIAADAMQRVAERAVAIAAEQVFGMRREFVLRQILRISPVERGGALQQGGTDGIDDRRQFHRLPAAGERRVRLITEVGEGGVAHVVQEELAVDPGGDVVHRLEAGQRGDFAAKAEAVDDQGVVGFGEELQRVFIQRVLRHDRDHLADAGLDEAQATVEIETLGQQRTEILAKPRGSGTQILGDDHIQRWRIVRRAQFQRCGQQRQHGLQAPLANRRCHAIGLREDVDHRRAIAPVDGAHATDQADLIGPVVLLDDDRVRAPLVEQGDEPRIDVDKDDPVTRFGEQPADERAPDVAGAELNERFCCICHYAADSR